MGQSVTVHRLPEAWRCQSSYLVPFSLMHHQIRAHGGYNPSGSSPASRKRRATTPCAGTPRAVKFRMAVPLSVCVHRSRTEYCRPALIHGDSVRLKNISAGSSNVFRSMKTVPFSLSPLQYCAGCVELLVQSGLIPHLNGLILVPTTGSWFIAIISVLVSISKVSSVIVGRSVLMRSGDLRRAHAMK